MATPEDLYAHPIRGFWQNEETKELYYTTYSVSADDNDRKVCEFVEAKVFNLRTGKPSVITLPDFSGLARLIWDQDEERYKKKNRKLFEKARCYFMISILENSK